MTIKKITLTSLAILFMAILGITGISEKAHAANERTDDNKATAHILGSTLEVHIFDSGNVLVRGAKIATISGDSFTATTMWGNANIVWTVRTSSETIIIRSVGDKSDMSELSVGDYVSFRGDLIENSSELTVKAEVVKNWSIRNQDSLSGMIQKVNANNNSFTFMNHLRGLITAFVSDTTIVSMNGNPSKFSEILVGKNATVRGLWNTVSNNLTAKEVKISPAESLKTIVEGKITAISDASLPTKFKMMSGSNDYTINAEKSTSILNSQWLNVEFEKFKVGDTVRVYGVINADMSVDATVVRNTSIL